MSKSSKMLMFRIACILLICFTCSIMVISSKSPKNHIYYINSNLKIEIVESIGNLLSTINSYNVLEEKFSLHDFGNEGFDDSIQNFIQLAAQGIHTIEEALQNDEANLLNILYKEVTNRRDMETLASLLPTTNEDQTEFTDFIHYNVVFLGASTAYRHLLKDSSAIKTIKKLLDVGETDRVSEINTALCYAFDVLSSLELLVKISKQRDASAARFCREGLKVKPHDAKLKKMVHAVSIRDFFWRSFFFTCKQKTRTSLEASRVSLLNVVKQDLSWLPPLPFDQNGFMLRHQEIAYQAILSLRHCMINVRRVNTFLILLFHNWRKIATFEPQSFPIIVNNDLLSFVDTHFTNDVSSLKLDDDWHHIFTLLKSNAPAQFLRDPKWMEDMTNVEKSLTPILALMQNAALKIDSAFTDWPEPANYINFCREHFVQIVQLVNAQTNFFSKLIVHIRKLSSMWMNLCLVRSKENSSSSTLQTKQLISSVAINNDCVIRTLLAAAIFCNCYTNLNLQFIRETTELFEHLEKCVPAPSKRANSVKKNKGAKHKKSKNKASSPRDKKILPEPFCPSKKALSPPVQSGDDDVTTNLPNTKSAKKTKKKKGKKKQNLKAGQKAASLSQACREINGEDTVSSPASVHTINSPIPVADDSISDCEDEESEEFNSTVSTSTFLTQSKKHTQQSKHYNVGSDSDPLSACATTQTSASKLHLPENTPPCIQHEASGHSDNEANVVDNDEANVHSDDETRVNGDGKTSVKGDDEVSVNDDDAAGVNGDGKTSVKGDDEVSVNDDDAAGVNDDGKTSVKGDDEVSVNDDDTAGVNDDGKTSVKGDDEANVHSDDETRVNVGNKTNVNRDDEVSVNDDDTAGVNDDGKTSVKGDDEVSVNDDDTAGVNGGEKIKKYSHQSASAITSKKALEPESTSEIVNRPSAILLAQSRTHQLCPSKDDTQKEVPKNAPPPQQKSVPGLIVKELEPIGSYTLIPSYIIAWKQSTSINELGIQIANLAQQYGVPKTIDTYAIYGIIESRLLYALNQIGNYYNTKCYTTRYGSVARNTQLHFPFTDFDIAIHCDYKFKDIDLLSQLATIITQRGLGFTIARPTGLFRGSNTAPPVLMLLYTLSNECYLKIDVTVFQPKLLESVQLFDGAHSAWRTLSILLKYFLRMYQLNEARFGGLSSFVLELLVLFHVQTQAKKCHHLGVCFLEFLMFFQDFDALNTCIIFENKIGKAVPRNQLFPGDQLCVPNPLNPSCNAANNAREFPRIQELFRTFQPLNFFLK